MGDVKKQRVDSALSSLIDNLIPLSLPEDGSTSNERRDDALEWAKTIVHGHVRSRKTRKHPLTSCIVVENLKWSLMSIMPRIL